MKTTLFNLIIIVLETVQTAPDAPIQTKTPPTKKRNQTKPNQRNEEKKRKPNQPGTWDKRADNPQPKRKNPIQSKGVYEEKVQEKTERRFTKPLMRTLDDDDDADPSSIQSWKFFSLIPTIMQSIIKTKWKPDI